MLARWETFRAKINAAKKILIKKLKRGMLAKRILMYVKLAKFMEKCKEIYAIIKTRRRFKESAMFVALALCFKMKKNLKVKGPTFQKRLINS